MLKNKTLIQRYIPLILLVLLAVSCEKNENVEDVTVQVEFLEPGYFGICFWGTPSGLDHEVIITDNESYQEYFEQKRIYPLVSVKLRILMKILMLPKNRNNLSVIIR